MHRGDLRVIFKAFIDSFAHICTNSKSTNWMVIGNVKLKIVKSLYVVYQFVKD